MARNIFSNMQNYYDLISVKKMAKKKKYVYFYGFGKANTEGDASMRALLGGKGGGLLAHGLGRVLTHGKHAEKEEGHPRDTNTTEHRNDGEHHG